MLFLSRRFSSVSSATHLLQGAGLAAQVLDLVGGGGRAVSPASRRLPASMNSFDQV